MQKKILIIFRAPIFLLSLKKCKYKTVAGILKGGPFEGMVVTKAGGFGKEDVLIKAEKYLKEEYCRQKDREAKGE